MMKSPTSLIRFRNAAGVMLALTAVFAVVLTAISIPSDEARAQVADAPDAVETRAEAWFNSLTLDQAINALLGKDADAVADVDGNADTQGRQYVDDDDPAENDQPIEFIYAAWNAKSDTQSFYDGLPADTAAETESGVANKAGVMTLVDGNTDTTGDIYAVGDHETDIVQAIRGFQSVELWWAYTSCVEARIAVGEDNDAVEATDQDDDATGFQAEESAVCDVTVNTAGDGIEQPTTRKAYGDLSNGAKATVDTVGQAILGLGDPPSPARGRDAAWWNLLTAAEMVLALYGEGSTNGDPTRTPPEDGSSPFTRPELAQKMYADLDDDTKALVTDRWQWIYNMGVRGNDDGLDGVIYWWNSIDSGQRRVAVGVDNEPQAAPDADGNGVDWDELSDDMTSSAGQMRQARALELGQAILGTAKPVPQVAAWWNTLNKDQMVYVVYGDPPLRTAYDDPNDDPDAGETVTTVTDADKAVFQKMYDGLTGGIEVEAVDTALSTHLPERITTMLARNGFDVTAASTNNNGTPADTTDDTFYYSAKDIVHALANEIFDPPAEMMAWVRPDGTLVTTSAAEDAPDASGVVRDNDFDWPYTPDNSPATVADWWDRTDCRVMRIAVGQDNNYLNGAVAAVVGVDNSSPADGDFDDPGDTAPADAIPAETSIYCGHFPGSPLIPMDGEPITVAAQKRIETVGNALLGLSGDSVRPSFNEEATGVPIISGTAQVGSELKSEKGSVDDDDGVGTFSYQWLRDGEPIPGATRSSYTLQPADVNAVISVRYSFTDGERFDEMRTSNATSTIAGSPGEISRIEASIRSVTVSAGDEVKLSVDIYGLQNAKDNDLAASFDWTQNGEGIDDAGNGREITYTAPSSPGAYAVTASLSGLECNPVVEADREDDCNATITVQVRRPPVPQPDPPDPQNPPGEIPTILTDGEGNQSTLR